jgi:hypothetical protein
VTFEEWVELVNRGLVSRIKAADLPDFKEGGYQLDSVGILQAVEKFSAQWTKDSRWVFLNYHELGSDIPPIWVTYLRPIAPDEKTDTSPLVVSRRPPAHSDRLLDVTLPDAEKLVNLLYGYLIEMNLPDEAPDGLL